MNYRRFNIKVACICHMLSSLLLASCAPTGSNLATQESSSIEDSSQSEQDLDNDSGPVDLPASNTPTSTPGSETSDSLPNSTNPRSSANVYFIGHSLVNHEMPSLLNEISDSLSINHDYNIHVINGASLEYQWNESQRTLNMNSSQYRGEGIRNDWSNAIIDLQSRNYNVVVITESIPLTANANDPSYNRTNFTPAQRIAFTSSYLINFYDIAIKANPTSQIYLYETWHHLDRPNLATWRQRLNNDFSTWEGIVTEVNRLRNGPDVQLIPAGQAMGALYDAMQAGTVPNLTDMYQLFYRTNPYTGDPDSIHLTPWGNYFVACVQFAAIYQQSPVGASNRLMGEWGLLTQGTSNTPWPTLPPETAQRMQEIAWNVVGNYANTHFHH